MFFGWGTDNKSWPLSDGRVLMATWSYFHIFFCPIGYSVRWHILSDKRSEDLIITHEKVKEMFPENTPDVGIWSMYGLLLVIAAIWLIAILFE